MNRGTYLALEKARKTIGVVILTAISAVGVFCGTSYLINRALTKQEKFDLESRGYVNLVKYDDKYINIAYKGTPQNHTIVPISDIGIQDFNVYMDFMTTDLQDDNLLVMIDRFGSGYSSDTQKTMTNEEIVNQYRTVLREQNIEGPYLLVAHQSGSLYATYWQQNFPDEIEGIIYIDPILMSSGNYPEYSLKKHAELYAIANTLGMTRWFYNKFYDAESTKVLSKYREAARALNSNSINTFGYISEVENLKDNFDEVVNNIKPTSIPKMYINSSYSFETEEDVAEYVKYVNEKARLSGKPLLYDEYSGDRMSERVQKAASDSTYVTENYIEPIAKSLGNCHIVKMPGDKLIYEQNPALVKIAIQGFVDYLDGNEQTIYERYVDSVAEKWKANAKNAEQY